MENSDTDAVVPTAKQGGEPQFSISDLPKPTKDGDVTYAVKGQEQFNYGTTTIKQFKEIAAYMADNKTGEAYVVHEYTPEVQIKESKKKNKTIL